MIKKTDFLVIGSGIAGLSYALKVASRHKNASVTLVTKAEKEESNTKYAQGGIATVTNTNTDSFEQHIQDTLIAGDGLCDEEVVRMVVEEAPERLDELIAWGAQFDKTTKGDYSLGREGGHSQNRILHHKDITGYEIARALLQKVEGTENITLLENHFTIDFITDHHILRAQGHEKTVTHRDHITCYGAYVLDEITQEIKTIQAKITLLAAGGSGQVYRTTTNPKIATGDGIAMAYRAKAKVQDIEFIQFHPTALHQEPGQSPAFLITEAVRGEGGILRNVNGERFMEKYDDRLELAPRDIVARAIDTELKITGEDFAYLDCTHIDPDHFLNHFPNITQKCKSLGIDVHKDYIPITPAAHYICGGIAVDKNGQTSIENLYACGECSRTGLHGANRLASNSLIEAVVYAHRSSVHASSILDKLTFRNDIPAWDDTNTSQNKEHILITHDRRDIQKIMSNYVGIVRSDIRLQKAANRLEILYQENKELYRTAKLSAPICELRNLITNAYLIIQSSIDRKENKGGFYNQDCVK
ncbi:L-aspartate oxidase [Wenyingzhuangia sp. 2_MG-2023]|uniref:L-aspartate oxidase n=1 Tax=Wenyingzhuangia sp. 2_MG-2023 TaxID=3062639 RepID=UPI0026E1A28D|nr:L-aspartate oxidase [Wenyingzhuangia sp. 2_MG-2023]MDO6738373.1 L-aspartate oxidase [Wenyingzhuangia sp. 2_MG-2023]